MPKNQNPETDGLELVWEDTARQSVGDDTWEVTLKTNAGEIQTRYHPAAEERKQGGVVLVGGAGGGLDGPGGGIYPELCRQWQQEGISGLRMHYRQPNDLPECVLDTLLGVEFLHGEGAEKSVLIGWSFGGAVVITAGALAEKVKGVATVATQTYGTDLAPELAPRPLLLLHGAADPVLPDTCSRMVFKNAREPKTLKIFEGGTHGLDEVRDEMFNLLLHWVPDVLTDVAS